MFGSNVPVSYTHLATGRGVGGIPPMIRELPGANYAITTNGAVIADLKTNKAIRTCGLSNEMVQRLSLIHICISFGDE